MISNPAPPIVELSPPTTPSAETKRSGVLAQTELHPAALARMIEAAGGDMVQLARMAYERGQQRGQGTMGPLVGCAGSKGCGARAMGPEGMCLDCGAMKRKREGSS